MNVLFVVPYMPSLVRSRPRNLLRSLVNRGHRVTLLTLWENKEERDEIEVMESWGCRVLSKPMPAWLSAINCLRALPGNAPLQSVYSFRPDLLHMLNGETFDVVHVEHLRGARYGLWLKRERGLPVVWDSVDCISYLFRQAAEESKSLLGRLRSRLDLERTERFEGWLLHQFDHVLITSPVDKAALAALNVTGEAGAPISVIGHGVDAEYFVPDTAVSREPATIVLSGKMSYHANVTMAVYLVREIMPLVWARRPDVKVWLVGKDPSREVQALAEHENVVVTGTVPEIRPFLQKATMAVVPMKYGAGIQNKILEAMACGTPVITSSNALAALQAKAEKDLLIANQPGEFAQKILWLLDNVTEQKRLGKNGRVYIEAHHQWDAITAKVETIYQQAIAKYQKPVLHSKLTVA